VKHTGRPSNETLAQRRRFIKIYLASSAAASDEAVKRISERLGVGEKAIRADLEALREEFEDGPADELAASLEQAILAADRFGALKRLGKKLMAEMAKQTLDRSLGAALVDAIREQRQLLVKEREEKTDAAIMALEILTPEEDALLKAHRKELAGPPVKPGQAVPPPVLVPPEKKPEKRAGEREQSEAKPESAEAKKEPSP